MILQELSALYDRLQADENISESVFPPIHFSSVDVSIVLEIDESGSLCYVGTFQDGSKYTTHPMAVPEHPFRSGIEPPPYFLCDTVEYLLGYDVESLGNSRLNASGKSASAVHRQAMSASLHHLVLDGVDDSEARAVLRFFDNPAPLENAPQTIVDVLKAGKWVVLRVSGNSRYVHDNRAIRAAWLNYCKRSEQGHVAIVGQDSVTGQRGVPIARLFPMSKGLRGTNPSGANLVSSNCESSNSYGKTQAYNASIGQDSANEAGAALNYLCQDDRHHMTFGKMTILFWSDRPASRENDLVFAILNGDGSRAEDTMQTERIEQLLSDMRAGRQNSVFELSTRFFLLGLVPGKARLSVRFFNVYTFGEIVQNYNCYLQDIGMDGCRATSIFVLLRAMVRYDTKKKLQDNLDNVPQTLVHDCAESMLSGSAFPKALFSAVISRMKADHGEAPNWMLSEQAALLKAYVVRLDRLKGLDRGEKGITMGLNTKNDDAGYVLGRLFALIEYVQQKANETKDSQGGLNSTVTDKYIAAASATPARCFPSLFRNLQNNMAKLRKDKTGLAVNTEKQIESVIGLLDGSSPLPAFLDEESQGRFFIGYYQQRQKLYERKTVEQDMNDADDKAVTELEA